MGNKLLMTSGYNFEGYSISEYLGVFSGECALGTGFLSSLGAGISDFLGKNSTMYSNKLKEAKTYALNQLQDQVIEIGGNAIIGLDIDYVSFSSDIMGVVASGTAVKLKGIPLPVTNQEAEIPRYPITSTNSGLPFRSSSLYIAPFTDNRFSFCLELFCPEDRPVSAIMVSISFTDIFLNSYSLENLIFTDFAQKKKNYLLSSAILQNLPQSLLKTLSTIRVTVQKYILNEELVDLTGAAIEYDSLIDSAASKDPTAIVSDLLAAVEELPNAKEIYEYIVSYNEDHLGVLDSQLIYRLEEQKKIERFYGNHKVSAIKEIKKYFNIE